jgi:hypothetical protein
LIHRQLFHRGDFHDKSLTALNFDILPRRGEEQRRSVAFHPQGLAA